MVGIGTVHVDSLDSVVRQLPYVCMIDTRLEWLSAGYLST